MPKYRRILLKITGELCGGDKKTGLDFSSIARLSEYLKFIHETYHTTLAVVVGGGNLFRGRNISDTSGFDHVQADFIGMLGTVMNGLAIQGELKSLGVDARVMSSLHIDQACEPYIRLKAISHLDKGRILVLAGGSGRPFFTTDTTSALLAAELNCEILLKGSNVDGVYSSDPNKNPLAKKYKSLTFREALEKGIMVMDDTAFAVCKRQKIPVVIFDIGNLSNIEKIIKGEEVGTLVT